MPRRLLTIPTTCLALAVAACGGDDRLSAKELRATAGTICARTAQRTDRIPVPSTPDQGVGFLRAGAAELLPELTKLAALKPPSELRASYRKAVVLGRHESGLIEGNANAIGRGADVIATFRSLQAQLAPLEREENAFWRALGIPACVRR